MAALTGKTAVVTGGSRGIGRAIVERLVHDGAAVVFSYAHDANSAAETESAAEKNGGSARAVRADLTEDGAAERLMRTAQNLLSGLDILVNNAAVAFPPTTIAESDDELYDRAMAASAGAVFRTIRHAANEMRDGGRVINISSLNTRRPAAGGACYVAGKGAVEQLTAVAALELGARGITVNTVSPGATDTDLLRSVNSPERLRAIAEMTPLGRLGRPSDVAAVVAFLVGPDGGWVTGQNLLVSGGVG